eukprot:768319-Hanusia_phi.AAC.4
MFIVPHISKSLLIDNCLPPYILIRHTWNSPAVSLLRSFFLLSCPPLFSRPPPALSSDLLVFFSQRLLLSSPSSSPPSRLTSNAIAFPEIAPQVSPGISGDEGIANEGDEQI